MNSMIALRDVKQSLHLANVTYVDDVPVAKIDCSGTRVSHTLLQSNVSLHFLTERLCRGYWDLSTLEDHPCPNRTLGDTNFCHNCRLRTGFNPAFYNVARSTLTPQQINYNAQPHAIYLAAFSNGVVKVGISHYARVRQRWLEQGARAALVLGVAANAYAAREVEAATVREQRIVERLTNSKKIELLCETFDPSKVERLLRDSAESIANARRIDIPIEIEWLDDCYFGAAKPALSKLRRADKAEREITGIWRGVVGHIVCVECGPHLLAYDISKLLGHQIVVHDASQSSVPQRTILPTQGSLF